MKDPITELYLESVLFEFSAGSVVNVKGKKVRVQGPGNHDGTWIGYELDDAGDKTETKVDFRDTDVQDRDDSTGDPKNEDVSGGGSACGALSTSGAQEGSTDQEMVGERFGRHTPSVRELRAIRRAKYRDSVKPGEKKSFWDGFRVKKTPSSGEESLADIFSEPIGQAEVKKPTLADIFDKPIEQQPERIPEPDYGAADQEAIDYRERQRALERDKELASKVHKKPEGTRTKLRPWLRKPKKAPQSVGEFFGQSNEAVTGHPGHKKVPPPGERALGKYDLSKTKTVQDMSQREIDEFEDRIDRLPNDGSTLNDLKRDVKRRAQSGAGAASGVMAGLDDEDELALRDKQKFNDVQATLARRQMMKKISGEVGVGKDAMNDWDQSIGDAKKEIKARRPGLHPVFRR